jgi:hypothetical protein
LWEVCLAAFQGCPSHVSDEMEGTSYLHIADPTGFIEKLHDRAWGHSYLKSVLKQHYESSAQIQWHRIEPLLTGTSTAGSVCRELQAQLAACSSQLLRLNACSCGGEARELAAREVKVAAMEARNEARRADRYAQRRAAAGAASERAGNSNDDDDKDDDDDEDEYYNSDADSDFSYDHPERNPQYHTRKCPKYPHDLMDRYEDDFDDDYDFGYGGGSRNKRQRGGAEKAIKEREERSEIMYHAELDLNEALTFATREWNPTAVAPSRMAVAELRAQAMATAGPGALITAEAAGQLTRRADLLRLIARRRGARLPDCSNLEWLRVTLVDAADHGEHVIIVHEVN